MNNHQTPAAVERMEALRNGLVNLDNAMAGVHQQVADLANFMAQTDQHLQDVRQRLTLQHRLQSATLLPNTFCGNTGQSTQRILENVNHYAEYTAIDDLGKYRLFPLILRNMIANWFAALPEAKVWPAALILLQEPASSSIVNRDLTESIEAYSVDMRNRLDMTGLLPKAENLKIYTKGLQPYLRG